MQRSETVNQRRLLRSVHYRTDSNQQGDEALKFKSVTKKGVTRPKSSFKQ